MYDARVSRHRLLRITRDYSPISFAVELIVDNNSFLIDFFASSKNGIVCRKFEEVVQNYEEICKILKV